MDMNKSFVLRKEDREPKWRLIDASGKVLGRLSTEIADALRGKDRPEYTPHTDAGDYVVVINCEKVKLTGDKWDSKEYTSYSGWMSGLKVRTAREMLVKKPEEIIKHSVKGMLPKNRLSRQILKKLKVYAGSEHNHQAQLSTAK
jgi:large subunit ribosomal protein L13